MGPVEPSETLEVTVRRLSDDLAARLARAGMAHHAPGLCQLIAPSARMDSAPADESEIALGDSKLGGRPDLPPGFEWPLYQGAPQSFIAQIDLGSLPTLGSAFAMPTSGLLSFFYDSRQSVWGFDPAETDAWVVHYTPNIGHLIRHEPPAGLPDEAVFGAARLRPRLELTCAPEESGDVALLGLTDDESFAYSDIVEQLIDPDDEPVHRLFGHPDPIQGDMQLECQLVAHGLYCGDPSGYQDPRARDLEPGALDWRLLLQVDTNEEIGMMWGDVGRIYYWMRNSDRVALRWQEARLILQSG